jgi:hypothetical protein
MIPVATKKAAPSDGCSFVEAAAFAGIASRFCARIFIRSAGTRKNL